MPSDESATPHAARDVLRYFLRNPRAADSLEGVARWRLLDEAIHHNVSETQAALRWLVACGYLTSRCSPGTEPTFSLNRNHRRAAETWIAARERAAPQPTPRIRSRLRRTI